MKHLRALVLAGPAPERALSRFLLLFLFALLLRSAALAYGILDIDEAHWSVIGRLLLDGASPYVDFADHKPPLVFYAFAAFRVLSGGSLVVQALLMVGYVAAIAAVLGGIARRLGASPQGAFLVGWVYVALTSCNVITANAELLSDLPVAAALLLATRLSPGRLLGAGALAAVAALVRPQAAIAGVSLVAACVLSGMWLRTKGAWRSAQAAVVGAALPLGATIAAFYAAGLLGPFWEWNVTRNLSYPAPTGWLGLLAEHGGLFLVGAQGWAFVVAAPVLARIFTRFRRRDPTLSPLSVLLPLLLALSFLAVFAGRRFYAHYFLQLALPLALLAGPRLGEVLEAAWEQQRVKRSRLLAIALLVLPVAFTAIHWGRGLAGRYPSQEPTVNAIVGYLRSPSAPPGRIAVWGDQSQIYLQADRLPASRFYNTAPLVGNFDANQVSDEFDVRAHVRSDDVTTYLADLERNRAAIVVDTSSGQLHHWYRFSLDKIAPIRTYLDRHFVLATTVSGARIYVRRSR